MNVESRSGAGIPSSRGYRVLLRLYPRVFRERYGAEMTRLFCADWRRRGVSGRVALAWATLWDAVWNGLGERMAHRRRTRRAREFPGKRAGPQKRRGEWSMEGVWRDVRFALRLFARAPGFAAIAVFTIGLGIGANTAIFTVVRAVLLRPLPYAQPDRLVMVWSDLVRRNIPHFPLSPPDLKDMREQTTSFTALEGVVTFAQALTGDGGEPEQVQLGGVTPGFLGMLGVRAELGRAFTEDDALPPADAAAPGAGPPIMVLLSDALWRRRYGGDPDVVGRGVELGGGPAIVVGVLPPGFRLYAPEAANLTTAIDAWVALRIDYATADRNTGFLRVIGRLAPGVTLARALEDLNGVVGRLDQQNERMHTAGRRMRVVPLRDDITVHVRPTVLALLGAVGFVLLIACANVSNLLLVRGAAREREMAVRAALGGGGLRIAQQVFVESLLLAGAGALLGTALAAGGVRLLLALQPANLPRIETVAVDGPVFVYTAAAAMLAALIFGTLPALHASRADLARALKDRGRASGARAQAMLHGSVVVLEVALSLVLLIGAGLMLRSFAVLRDVQPGFEPQNLLTFELGLPFGRYPAPVDRATFSRLLRERLEAESGIQSATAAMPLPLTSVANHGPYGREEALGQPDQLKQADLRIVLPEYFATMRTAVIAGRTLSAADESDSAAVVVVDRVLAEKTWPGESAVGKRMLIRLFTPEPIFVDVVGVVDHQRNGTLAAEGRETVYFPGRFAGSWNNMHWAVRTTGDPLRAVGAVRAVLAELDPLLPISRVQPMTEYVDGAMAPTRFALILIGIFGLTALLLASIGLYGVLAYAVRQRTAEIGLRMAFGARGTSILRMVVTEGLRLAFIGVVLGLAAALALTRVLGTLLVGVQPTDATTYAAVAALFLAIAALACYVPAWRATRVDPLVALRAE